VTALSGPALLVAGVFAAVATCLRRTARAPVWLSLPWSRCFGVTQALQLPVTALLLPLMAVQCRTLGLCEALTPLARPVILLFLGVNARVQAS
jgi:hypothetical protein